jgi:hypothetical protein
MSKKNWIIVCCIFLIVAITLSIRSRYREMMLIKTKCTFGIIEKISSGTARGAGFIKFKFTNNLNEQISTQHIGSVSICTNNIMVGDTVVIRYSLKDNQIAQVIKCYWNDALRKKYLVKH